MSILPVISDHSRSQDRRNGLSSLVRGLFNDGFKNITPILEYDGFSCQALQLGSDMLVRRCLQSFLLLSESVFATLLAIN